MPTLAEMRAKLAALENRKSNRKFTSDDVFPFWNMSTGTSTRLRFLPDSNTENPFFWVEKNTIRLPFNGIVGGDTNTTNVIVPCMDTWQETCPILSETRPWWNDETMKPFAQKYWKKRNFIYQGFVQTSELKEEEAPENPIRRFMINPQLQTLIKASLMDVEFDSEPIDYDNGVDFIITKSQKGDYADYTTSNWARKESALDDVQRAAIEQYGLNDLSTFLPKKPTPEAQAIIFEMFQASLEGEAYDPSRWGEFYTPMGYTHTASNSAAKPTTAPPQAAPQSTTTATPTSDEIPFDPDPVTVTVTSAPPAPAETPTAAVEEPAHSDPGNAAPTSAADILNKIRSRKK